MSNDYNNKRYYWIKLKDTFFTSDTVDFLMSQKDGANYVVLYQMLCLKTANTNGELSRQIGEIIIPFDIEKIQRDCKYFTIDTIRVALELYKKLGLIYQQENGILSIANFNNLIGSESQNAIYKREKRAEKNELESVQQNSNKILDIRDKIIDNRDIKEIISKDITKKGKQVKIPTYDEVLEYAKQRGREDLAQKFYDYYTAMEWTDKDGKKVLRWKGKFITWENNNPQSKQNKDINKGKDYSIYDE